MRSEAIVAHCPLIILVPYPQIEMQLTGIDRSAKCSSFMVRLDQRFPDYEARPQGGAVGPLGWGYLLYERDIYFERSMGAA